jgi:hypothetical protein
MGNFVTGNSSLMTQYAPIRKTSRSKAVQKNDGCFLCERYATHKYSAKGMQNCK